MGIIDQAKEVANTAVDKAKEKSIGDDFLADVIIKHTTKQEHINEILQSKASNYRIGNIEIEVGIPPKVAYVIEKKSDN